MGVTLQSCFGGSAKLFKVKHLKERSFRFSIASKFVGFHIYNSGKISEKDFECSFHLWGKGGPNWKFEESKYYKELDAKWTMVNRSRPSVFDRLQPSSSARATVPIASIFSRLTFLAVSVQAGSQGFQNRVNSNNEGLIGPRLCKW